MLILLVSKERHQSFRQLIVLSFFLSTIIAVAVVSMLMLFGITIRPFSISIIYLLLIFTLIVLIAMFGRTSRIQASHLDCAFLGISFITYIILVHIFTSVPRLFTMDETTYIAFSRYAMLKGETYPICSALGATGGFNLKCLVMGRFFWTLLIASFLGSTGLPAHQAYTISSMFLPMIAIASTLLIPSKFKENKLLEVGTFMLVLFNPLLLLFSGFVLNDLAVSFYLLLAIIFFVRSFIQNSQDKASINLHYLLISFLTLIVAFLIKENVVVTFPMYVILIFHIVRHRLHKVSKTWKVLLYALTLPLIAYEVLIDIPYVVSVWFIRNETIAMLTKRFLFISPAELFLGLFIPMPWKPTTVFSYDLYGYMDYLYRMFSPENLSIMAASVGLTLPLTLTLKGFREDIQIRLLVYITIAVSWLSYVLYLSVGCFPDIPRYFLYMTPIFLVICLTTLYEIFSNRNITIAITLTLPMLLLLWIQSTLSVEKQGVMIGYGLPRLNWTGTLLIGQLIIYVVLCLLAHYKRIITFKMNSLLCYHNKSYNVSINSTRAILLTLIIIMIVSSIYFSTYFISNSYYFSENAAYRTGELIRELDLQDALIISNFYSYMRPYIPDTLVTKNFLFPPPMTEDEFFYFLEAVPVRTFIFITQDPKISWYEYANNYIKRCLGGYALPLGSRIVKPIRKTNSIRIYELNSLPRLRTSNNDRNASINVEQVKIYMTNSTNVRLMIKANTTIPQKIVILIGTWRFSKILTVELKQGLNELSWDFQYRLKNRTRYGTYIARMSKVLICDENGNLLYDKIHAFTLSGGYLTFWLLKLIIVICLFVLILNRRFDLG